MKNKRNELDFLDQKEHGDAIFSAFNKYYELMFRRIDAFQTAEIRRDYTTMYVALSHLYSLVAPKISADVRNNIKDCLSDLRNIYLKPKKAITVQLTQEYNNAKLEKSQELQTLFGLIISELENKNMLVPTFHQDFRPVSVR